MIQIKKRLENVTLVNEINLKICEKKRIAMVFLLDGRF